MLRDVQQKLADVATVAEENIVGVHVVKAFAQEPAEEEKFRRPLRARLRADAEGEPPARDLRAAALVPAAARAGGRAARRRAHGRPRHSLTPGSFVAFNLYLAMLVMPLRALGMWIGQAQRATASGERIFEVLDEPEEIADRPGRGRAARRDRARSASRASRSGTPEGGRCCATSTSTLAAGTTVALIGHTGSGKTTLTSLVPRFYDVTAGRVTRRRRRRARRDARLAAPRDRRDLAGSVPLLGDRAREHRLRRADLTDEEVERAARARAGARVHRAAAATATTR